MGVSRKIYSKPLISPVIAFTGHRPNKLGGYAKNPISEWVKGQIVKKLLELKPSKVISGMALGVDTWAAEAAIQLGIPFEAAIPFEGQESKWTPESIAYFNYLKSKASEVIIVCEGDYHPRKMQLRNQYMVNNCDLLIAVWDGSSGGTANCVNYAKSKNKKIIYINPIGVVSSSEGDLPF